MIRTPPPNTDEGFEISQQGDVLIPERVNVMLSVVRLVEQDRDGEAVILSLLVVPEELMCNMRPVVRSRTSTRDEIQPVVANNGASSSSTEKMVVAGKTTRVKEDTWSDISETSATSYRRATWLGMKMLAGKVTALVKGNPEVAATTAVSTAGTLVFVTPGVASGITTGVGKAVLGAAGLALMHPVGALTMAGTTVLSRVAIKAAKRAIRSQVSERAVEDAQFVLDNSDMEVFVPIELDLDKQENEHFTELQLNSGLIRNRHVRRRVERSIGLEAKAKFTYNPKPSAAQTLVIKKWMSDRCDVYHVRHANRSGVVEKAFVSYLIPTDCELEAREALATRGVARRMARATQKSFWSFTWDGLLPSIYRGTVPTPVAH